jgi:hypothetical protein
MQKANTVYIAVAFFTDIKILQLLEKNNCQVRIIVRLGYPTSPDALYSILNMKNVQARFFSDRSFHPKLYIFGASDAIIGSANLTDSAFTTNQEIMVHIGADDSRFNDFIILFEEYWNDAKVLTHTIVDDYLTAYNQYKEINSEISSLQSEIYNRIGKVSSNNITRHNQKLNQKSVFIEDFRKTYQECVNAFNTIRDVYISSGKRKVNEEKIPLRLEIDSFISFVREKYAIKDLWEDSPIISGDKQKHKIEEHILEWHNTTWEYFEDTIVNVKYPNLMNVFSSEEKLKKSSTEEIFTALCSIHSFHDRLRFFPGGLETLKQSFLGKNSFDNIIKGLAYLLFGSDDIIVRMAKLIFDNYFKLYDFGQSNVQELVGWINNKDLPVINGRTTKVLRYFGFAVRQL